MYKNMGQELERSRVVPYMFARKIRNLIKVGMLSLKAG